LTRPGYPHGGIPEVLLDRQTFVFAAKSSIFLCETTHYHRMRISLFVPCLVDQFFPQIAVSTVRILRRLGVEVTYPEAQTCCGQPAFNMGYHNEAKKLAERFVEIFADAEYIVTPSGSCASMVRVFYPTLPFHKDLELSLENVRKRTFELSEFLVDILKVTDIGAVFSGRVTYHDSCHLLRELNVKDPPRLLLRSVKGIEFIESEESNACCGFGGSFSVKFPEISTAMVEEKVKSIQKTGAQYVVAGDTGCLMQIGGMLQRRRIPVKTMHIAEFLDRGISP
jgi:L-lactate dehydrogenase complex protein LldE